MDNYERVTELQEVAANSEGRADEQFAKYADTVEYKINQLRNSWEQLRTSFLDSDMFKNAISGLTEFVDKINELDGVDLATIGVIGFTLGKTIVKNFINSVQSSSNEVRTAYQTLMLKATSKLKIKTKFEIETEEYNREIGLIKANIVNLAQEHNIAATSITSDVFDIIKKYQELETEEKELGNQLTEQNRKRLLEIEQEKLALQGLFKQKTDASESDTVSFFDDITSRRGNAGNSGGTDIGKERPKDRFAGIKTAAADAAKSGIVTGILAGITSKDVKTGIKAGLGSAFTYAAPSMISGLAKLASSHPVAAAITAAVTAAVFAGVSIYKAVTDEGLSKAEKIAQEIELVEEKLKDLESRASDTQGTAKESAAEVENTKKLKEEYEELYGKTVLTTEEQEKKNKLIEEIREKYPQIVKFYNAETGELQVQNELWDDIIDKQNEIAKIDLHYASVANYLKTAAEYNLDNLKVSEKIAKLDEARITTDVLELVLTARLVDNKSNSEILKELKENGFNTDIIENNKIGIDGDDFVDAIVNANKDIQDEYNNLLDSEQETQASYIKSRELVLAKELAIAEDMAVTLGTSTGVANAITQGVDAVVQNRIELTLAYALAYDLEHLSGLDPRIKNLEAYAGVIGRGSTIARLFGSDYSLFQEGINALSDFGISFFDEWNSDMLVEFDELDEKLLKALRDVYGTDVIQKWNEELRKNEKLIDKQSVAAALEINETEEEVKSFYESLDELQKASINKWIDNIAQASIEDLQGDVFKDFLSGFDAKQGELLTSFRDKQVEELKKSLEAIENIFGEGLFGDLTKASLEQLSSFQTYATELVDQIGADIALAYGQSITKIFKNNKIKEENLLPLLRQIDWTLASASGWRDFREQGINAIAEITGKGKNEVTKFFDEWAAAAEQVSILDIRINNEAELDEYIEKLEEIRKISLDSKDTIISAINEQAENGIISLKTYYQLLEVIENLHGNVEDYITVGKSGEIKLNTAAIGQLYAESVVDPDGLLHTALEEAYQELSNLRAQQRIGTEESLIEEIKAQEEIIKSTEEKYETLRRLAKSFFEDYKKTLEDIKDETLKALDDAEEAERKAQESRNKAFETLIEKEKALYDMLHGKSDWLTSLSDTYNYDTNYSRATTLADRAQSQLEDLQENDNAHDLLNKYIDNIHKETVIGQAETRVLEQAILNGQKTLNDNLVNRISTLNEKYGASFSTDLSGLYEKVGNRYNVNEKKLNELKLPKEYKTMIESEIDSWNKNLDKIEEILDKKLERQKQFNEAYKKSLNDMVNLQLEMANALKEKYQKEIDDVTEKYNSMKNADDEYLSALETAIEKERKLRDRQNEWDDLATKEKKLSLMQRDTSGANVLDRQKLEKEIQQDRTKLLDESVDDVVDNLKELYETQEEERQAELEVLNALIDEASLMKEAVEALMTIDSGDELAAWFANVKDMSGMTQEQIELEQMGWKELFDAKTTYMELSQADFNKALETSTTEINNTVDSYSQTLTAKAEITLSSISEDVDEAIQNAKTAYADAAKDLSQKEKDLTDAINNTTQAQNKYNIAVENFNNIAKTSVTNILDSVDTIKKAAERLTGKPDVDSTKFTNIAQYEQWKGLNGISNVITSSNTSMSYGEQNARAAANRNTSNNGIESTSTTLDNSIKNEIYSILGGTSNAKIAMENLILNLSNGGKTFTFEDSGFTGAQIDAVIEEIKKEKSIYGFRYGNNNVYLTLNTDDNAYETAISGNKFTKKYAKGGLVPYTGPAWVDGTPSKPEAFLSAEDTRRIGELAELLENLPIFNPGFNSDNISTTNIGDTTIEVNINIENVSSDYDVDQAVERVKQDIVDAARYTGSRVILKQ